MLRQYPRSGSIEKDATIIEGLGGATTFARAINDSGQVTGDGADADGVTHAFIWSEAEGIRAIHSPPEGVSRVLGRAIGPDGTVVGTHPTADGPYLAWRWSPETGSAMLDDLVELPTGWHVRDAWAIADDGSIVIEVYDATDAAQPAVLRPLGGPTTTVTDDAHLDVLSIDWDGTAIHLGIVHSDHRTRLEPASTVIDVRPTARTRIGEAPPLPFLGPAGTPIWSLDGGWTVHDAPEGAFADDRLTVHVERVEGPGSLAVWRFGADAPEVAFTSLEPLPSSFDVDHDAHVHRTWSFTQPGSYAVRIRVAGMLADGHTPVGTDRVTYRFEVRE